MDPLVRSALWVQKLIARTSGVALSAGFGAYLVYWETVPPPAVWNYVALAVFGVSLGYRVVQRLRRLVPDETARLDLELFTHLCVGALGVIVRLPSGLDGPYYPVMYALAMLM